MQYTIYLRVKLKKREMILLSIFEKETLSVFHKRNMWLSEYKHPYDKKKAFKKGITSYVIAAVHIWNKLELKIVQQLRSWHLIKEVSTWSNTACAHICRIIISKNVRTN